MNNNKKEIIEECVKATLKRSAWLLVVFVTWVIYYLMISDVTYLSNKDWFIIISVTSILLIICTALEFVYQLWKKGILFKKGSSQDD
ncbi:MAG: hypothetical protein PUH10_04560 [Erysipelotrichaceae bacterium]|uniref:hypothetical protein n=1 Tax=Floccifex sp. TaxID=2815810 RepID=UPI002A7628FE|nr:hypothetical protein [Floccifex sp.]MDD7281252.1 hypothetical protein [Erysipelotrichaceae bacterium]MDY2958737.1 hypothetical protein [Floccifex sp.]